MHSKQYVLEPQTHCAHPVDKASSSGSPMNMDSLRLAIEILADQTENTADYTKILQFTARAHHLPTKTIEQLVRCYLADKQSSALSD